MFIADNIAYNMHAYLLCTVVVQYFPYIASCNRSVSCDKLADCPN